MWCPSSSPGLSLQERTAERLAGPGACGTARRLPASPWQCWGGGAGAVNGGWSCLSLVTETRLQLNTSLWLLPSPNVSPGSSSRPSDPSSRPF